MSVRRLAGWAGRRLAVIPGRFRPKSKAGKAGAIAGGVVLGLVALDLIAIGVTAVVASGALAR